MQRALCLLAVCACVLAGCGGSSTSTLPPQTSLASALQGALQGYLAQHGTDEHISAAALSVSLKGSATTIDVAAGTTSFGGTTPATASNLYQIGSNTKAMTAVIVLQLEAEGKLNINQTVGFWLPQYPAWANVTIKQLFNMTSGIQTYDASQTFQTTYSAAPSNFYPATQLIGYVSQATPLVPGWTYSNTNYELAQLIIEKVTGHSYATEIQNRIITPNGLQNTYYNADIYPANVQSQMVSGYFWNTTPGNEGLAPLVGQDQKPLSTSWAQAAGGVVSSMSDMTKWTRAMYEGSALPAAQRAELMTLVSQQTGLPIASVSASDPRGFGLGVAQAVLPSVGGAIWFYEGETLGYRVLHAWFPSQDAIVAIGLNSQPGTDHIGDLITNVYDILKAYNAL